MTTYTTRATPTLDAYLETAAAVDRPDADLCMKIARAYERQGDASAAMHWLGQLGDAPTSFAAWSAAAGLIARLKEHGLLNATRHVRLGMTGSSTTSQLGAMLQVAALHEGICLDVHETAYGQYAQELLEPSPELREFQPTHVLVAVDDGAARLPVFSESPADDVAVEVQRWTSLWRSAQRLQARLIQYTFVPRPEVALGHLSVRLPGSRQSMLRRLNQELGAAAGDDVLLVDCERLAAWFGTSRWFDPRYWFLAKQAVALDALPLLAQHTVAVLAGSLGLSKKCIVLDLDNTLWGGVIGEDGLAGITLGSGPQGEAFVAFQEFLLQLKDKGIVLAVASKNNDADARAVFTNHPDMRLRLSDVTAFVCNWNDKATNLKLIADDLNLGLDSFVLVDDNPAETALVRQLLPEVDIITLPPDPSHYTRALAGYLRLETATLDEEDRSRTRQYQARAEVDRLAVTASQEGSLTEFYRGLNMHAVIAPFDELHLPRIAQLISKTNQFNLTTRRYRAEELRALMTDPRVLHLYVKLRDRFADHGLVGVLIARQDQDSLEIDTWLMSCRVIGRTVEDAVLARVCALMDARGCTRLRGTYIPTAKNQLVKNLYGRFNFTLVDGTEGAMATTWEYDLSHQGPVRSEYIDDEYTTDDPA